MYALEAVIFDLDGLLIDSEPYWQAAQIEILGELGVPLTPADCRTTTGMRIEEVIAYWHRRFPWSGQSPVEVAARVRRRVIESIQTDGELKAGVVPALEFVRRRGVRCALASSSACELIDAFLERFALRSYFDVISSAESEAYGKPHPAVYLSTAQRLALAPQHCLAIEDSLNGVIAAKAAQMRCLAVPERPVADDRRWGVADMVLESLAQLDEEVWRRLQSL